jgi:hypothetical protein
MLNDAIWVVIKLVWNPSWFWLTTRIRWAQVREFRRFGACFYTYALIIWTVLLQLVSEKNSTLNTSYGNLKTKAFGCEKCFSTYKTYKCQQSKIISIVCQWSHPLAQIRTLRWLIKVLTWGSYLFFCFVVHMAWYCMDVICLGGNVWIKMPLWLGKCELWEHDRPIM